MSRLSLVSVPVAPGRRGDRGIQFAPTRRLLALKERYESLANDPASDDNLKAYSRELVAEIVAELRARNRRQQGRAA